MNENVLNKREIKIKGKNLLQELRKRVHKLKLGGILGSARYQGAAEHSHHADLQRLGC